MTVSVTAGLAGKPTFCDGWHLLERVSHSHEAVERVVCGACRLLVTSLPVLPAGDVKPQNVLLDGDDWNVLVRPGDSASLRALHWAENRPRCTPCLPTTNTPMRASPEQPCSAIGIFCLHGAVRPYCCS